MIIKPADGERLWDSWLYEYDGAMHLFYLASREGEGRIAHAISRDLLHWERRADLLLPHYPLTGMVVRHGERFVMLIGEQIGRVQTNRAYESRDLEHWRPLAGAARLMPQGPHYLSRPDAWRPSVPWRDPFLYRGKADGCWHALLCAARPDSGPDDTGAALAQVRTADFRTWEYLPPVDAPTGRFYHVEVPERFELDGMHYIIFSTASCYGIVLNTPARRETVGTYYMKAEQPQGPYQLPDEYLLVGAGGGRMHSYVGRHAFLRDMPVVYHHVRLDGEAWDGVWAVPKRLCREGNGDLHPGLLPSVLGLGTPVALELPGNPGPGWSKTGAGLEARAAAMGTACTVAAKGKDFILQATLRGRGAARCGVALRATETAAVLVQLDFEHGSADIGVGRRHPVAGWGMDFSGVASSGRSIDQSYRIDTCGVALEQGVPYNLTVLVRGEYVEVYLDERWVFTTIVSSVPASGAVILIAERGEAGFSDLELRELPPLMESRCPGEISMSGDGGAW